MARRSEPEPLTLGICEVISEFLSDYASGPRSTARLYEQRIGRLDAWCKATAITNLADVTPKVLREFFAAESTRTYVKGGRERAMSQQSTVLLQDAVSRYFNWSVAQGYLEESPMRQVRRVPRPTLANKAFQRDEVTKLIREAGKAAGWLAKRDRAIVLFMLDTGARRSEVCALTNRELDWPRHRVLLHGKGAKDRWVPLGAKAGRAMKDYLGVRPSNPAPNIFLTLRHTAYNVKLLDASIANLGKYAGVEHCHPHRFRHTYAVEWYQRHRDIMALKNLLGHAKVETTQGYLRSLGIEYGTNGEYQTPGDFL